MSFNQGDQLKSWYQQWSYSVQVKQKKKANKAY